jgi:hypothetical protein
VQDVLSRRRPIGELPLAVGPVCLGAVGSANVIRAAYDAGINFFSIAVDMHWPLYEPVRRGLADLLRDKPSARDEIVVMGIAYSSNPSFCHAPFAELLQAEPSLQRLDVSAMGAVGDLDLLIRWNEHAKHRAGSVPGVRAIAGMLEGHVCPRVAVNFGLVDLAFVATRPSLHHAREERRRMFKDPPPVPIFAMGTLLDTPSNARLDELGIGADKWRPTRFDYIRYALSFEPFTGVFTELGNERSVETLITALEKGPLDEEEIQYLEDLSDLDLGMAEMAPR